MNNIGTFRFRLNCIDHYQAVPTDLDPALRRFRPSQRQSGSESVPHVPVIRVFGATETGQKVCAHIHGALPYLYLDYDGSLDKDAVNAYIRSLRSSIDHALAATYRRNPYDGKAVYVGHISLVKGIPYYGYHVGYSFFLKVYLLNPAHMTRFADLLHQGAILNRVFQPYESHLQYLLQWMCDYNLYGCSYINCAKVQFRGPVPDSDDIDTATHKWHDASIPDHLIASQDQYSRQSHCALEIDVCVQDILNRHDLHSRPIHHELFEQSPALKQDEKYVPSLADLWKDETLRRKRRMGLTDPSSSPFPPEVLVSMSADQRNAANGGWIHEEEYRELLEKLIREEGQQNPPIKSTEGGDWVQTALDSVEDLYPANLDIRSFLEDEDLLLQPAADDTGAPAEDAESVADDVSDHLSVVNPADLAESPSLDPLSLSEAQIQKACNYESRSSKSSVNDSDDSHGHDHACNPAGSARPRNRSPSPEDNERRKRHRLSSNHAIGPRVPVHSAHASEHTSDKEEKDSIQSQGHDGPGALSRPVVEISHASETVPRLSQPDYPSSQNQPKLVGDREFGRNSNKVAPTSPWTHQPLFLVQNGINSLKSHPAATPIATFSAETTPPRAQTLYYRFLPPSADAVMESMPSVGLLPVLYQNAYFSDEADVPERPREYAGRGFTLQSISIPYLPLFDPSGASPAINGDHSATSIDRMRAGTHLRSLKCSLRHWEFDTAPPTHKQINQWIDEEMAPHAVAQAPKAASSLQSRKVSFTHISQVDGPTQANKHGFRYSQKKASPGVNHETQYMSILSLEVHVNSRKNLAPDPARDEIQSIFWCVEDENCESDNHRRVGILCLSDDDGIVSQVRKQTKVAVEAEEDELDLINRVVDIVRYFDPDILTGYEVHNGSWGYLIERARLKFEYDLCDEISRTRSQSRGRFGKDADRWGFTHTSTIHVTGRHVINIWRAMRGELNLLQYTMENVVFHLLHKRIPHYQYSDLTSWYTSSKPRDLAKVLDYFLIRVQLNLDILEANEIVARTSEQARLLGVDFFSVISRGSQFKVESTMFRIAKPENFILVSPSRKQVGEQNALECLPLVMEPQSAFYPSPVLVLDFQALYPSVMIAYNYCYSTCLGRVVPWRGRNKIGFTDFAREPGLLNLAKDHINIAPNGIMYVKPEMRKSLLAKMLGEILETRVMVKSGMKADKDDRALQQLLNNRQLALKLLANVTYGYTSASFSGRMPCSEIADSIVQTGRETLEKAIALIHSVEKWNAEVVYGDTDSLFVHLKGRTRDQAFAIGEEIAEAVTKANPRPIKLKFEKVYHPCVLLAKKRYVGFKYESRHQKEPDFDAKGIETVRRDGTPAEQKIEERALKILFRTSDLSQVKAYFLNQCTKIMEGRISIQDFLFAKEVKLGTYADRGPLPPGALVAAKRMLADPRAEPQYGERVPYVVVTGPPGARLADRCVSPETLLFNDHIELDADYYISKNLIPPLERIFNLVGANVRQWYDEMPKKQRIKHVMLPTDHQQPNSNGLLFGGNGDPKKTLKGYLGTSICLVCRKKLAPVSSNHGEPLRLPLCRQCLRKPARALLALKYTIWKSDTRYKQVEMVCRSCSNLAWGEEVRCDNRDCPVFYTRVKERSRLVGLKDSVARIVEKLEEGISDEESEVKEDEELEQEDDVDVDFDVDDDSEGEEDDEKPRKEQRGERLGDVMDW